MKKENGQTKRVDSERKNKTPTPYKKGAKYRQKRKSTSIYFLLWAVFSAFAFVILLALGFTQNFLFAQTYKREIAKDVNQKGDRIVADLYAALPSHQNWNIYVERLALRYGVHIVILDGEGKVLLPQTEGERNFQGDVITLKEKLAERQQNDVTYEGNGEYVFGAKLSALGESEAYVYVYRSLELLETVGAEMRLRTGLVSGFALVLAFAISSAVSGWLTRPIAEMTRSARRLAEGDFHVDFHGNDYGSELAELAEMLNFARDEISKTDTMQKELIANVSHDFKTPLTMIKAYSSMIKDMCFLRFEGTLMVFSSKKCIDSEEHSKEITKTFAAVFLLALSVWNSSGLWKIISPCFSVMNFSSVLISTIPESTYTITQKLCLSPL